MDTTITSVGESPGSTCREFTRPVIPQRIEARFIPVYVYLVPVQWQRDSNKYAARGNIDSPQTLHFNEFLKALLLMDQEV